MSVKRDKKNYTISLDPSRRRIKIIGGGIVALRKLQPLLGRTQRLMVIAPEVLPEIAAQAAAGTLIWQRRRALPTDIAAGDLVFLAAPLPDDGLEFAARAQQVGAWINNAIDARQGDFAVPSVWETGVLSGTVAGAGASPRLLKLVRDDLEQRYLPVATALEELRSLREKVRHSGLSEKARGEFWRICLPENTVKRILAGEWTIIKGEIEDAIGSLGSES